MIKLITVSIISSILFTFPVEALPSLGGNNQQQGQLQGQGQNQRSNNTNKNQNTLVNGNSNRNDNTNTNLNGNVNRNRSESGSNSVSGSNSHSQSDSNSSGVGVGVGTGGESNSSATGGNSNSLSEGSNSSSNSSGVGGDSNASNGDQSLSNGVKTVVDGGVSGVSNSTAITDEGDNFTTIVLPDPVDINLPQNTQPGMTSQCRYLGVHSDYINGRSSGVSLYVFGFSSSKTPSDIHALGEDGIKSTIVCGLSDQLLSELTGESSLLTPAEKAAIQRLAADQLLHNLYRVNGQEYKPRYLDLEGINRTPIPTIDTLN